MDDPAEKPYVSVIKVNGCPILPPLITSESRKELLKYKQQAVRLEQRLKHFRDLKRNFNELLQFKNSSAHITEPQAGALKNCDKYSCVKPWKTSKLSKALLEVTQFNGSGVKTICSNISLVDGSEGETLLNYDAERLRIRSSRCKSESQDNGEPIKPNDETSPKPRLIRSNSYTLDSPSPVLLEHLRNNLVPAYNTESSNILNSTSPKTNNSSLDNDKVNQENPELTLNLDSPDQSARTVIEEYKSPIIEVYQTDISVQQITVNTNDRAVNDKEAKAEMFFSKNPFQAIEPDGELLNVLKDIPDEYAQQIIDLLKKQHIEQKQRLERYERIQGNNEELESVRSDFSSECKSAESTSNLDVPLQKVHTQSRNCDNLKDLTPLEYSRTPKSIKQVPSSLENRPNTTESLNSNNSAKPPSETLRRSSTFSISPSQSLYYSFTSDSDTIASRLVPCSNSIEENNGRDLKEIELGVLREKNGYLEGVLRHESRRNISRELFQEIDPITNNAIRQEWAASVIGAHVRGYLTRRLLRTEKVQNVIGTIKDVLVCALELHQSENIDEKDVELHRRLINQLSAALYSFHEIFFDLSIKEQMLTISVDRQRKLEKYKWPRPGRGSMRSRSANTTV
ncbi:centriolar coiled-coil protein of 110 kDa [Euwallacea similis]|uniref:centriolar coiled-coil protein of 110 kDa n=1 Tax=Euwallacea similis TaxID=1736056 RepID=UPI0034506AE3